ncbi:hypothetical protein DL89DRAFT_323664 [Linderina pennispora]|uniref:Aminopeptidase P N-terminal domain-containing protein n=1 Tax=Linderina pennispora TaxID=61395 RepID=A0A1Y1W5K7_9FUNG|nr:uncharacterized protein DL89DRAFT_323664 [Linderina pennispora]ORX68813.1 hypothetical protein DL89DRAFT_323664 [Linderina pennispora]
MSTYPAKQHFINTAKKLGATSGVIFVRGGETIVHPDSDTEYEFHQDSNFYYLSGVRSPGFSAAYDIGANKAILFAYYVDADEAVWIGVPPTLEELRTSHGFDEAYYAKDIDTIYTLPHHSTAQLGALASQVESERLLEAVHEARVFKDDYEVDVMRRANKISGDAHAQLHGRFIGLTISQGCLYEAYGGIVARGRNAAILHYTKNNQLEDYASDITRTWPVGAKFTPECRAIYEIVLDMQKQVIAACGPHKQWEDMHALSNQVAAQGLLKLGILKGDLAEIAKHHVVGYFMPHGIGHLIGIDTHDVAGYPKGVERINAPGLRYLRARREMLPQMAFTVEPGPANPEVAQFIDFDVVAKYRKVGGVRIEDNIVITESGNTNLTDCPKEVDEIEAIRAAALAAQ